MLSRIKMWWKLRVKHMDVSDYYIEEHRKRGMIIGEGCHFFAEDFAAEPFLVSVGRHCTIAYGAYCLTHDNAICHFTEDKSDFFGEIKIGNNCFIGYRALILPGVTIGDNCIVGAGSVVVKSVPLGKVVAGNPARIICDTADYVKRNEPFGFSSSIIVRTRDFFSEHEERMTKKKVVDR